MEMEQIIRELQTVQSKYENDDISDRGYARGIARAVVHLVDFIANNLVPARNPKHD